MEKKNLNEYLPFYIGCEIDAGHGETFTLVGIHFDDFNKIANALVLNGNITHATALNGLKLILRPLKTITEGERKELYKLIFGRDSPSYDDADDPWADCLLYNYNQHVITLYLLKKGFDLFELIEAGLAVEKK